MSPTRREPGFHGELTVEQVLGHRSRVPTVGGARLKAAFDFAAQPFLAHQPGHALGADGVGAGP